MLQTRTFAAVIFRRQSSKPRKTASGQTTDLFLTLNPAEREVIRAKLLHCLATETDNSVRGKIGDAVAELARQHTDDGKKLIGFTTFNKFLTGIEIAWPELLGALFQASQSQDPAQRENAFRIFSTTPQIIEKQHEDVVMTAFKGGFADGETSVGTFFCFKKTICLFNLLGSNCCCRSLCVLLPLHHQKSSEQVFPPHS